jgi:hypothetical protein
MRKTNCFVKVTISLADHELEFILRGIPILYTTRKRAKDFTHPVMVHEITASVPERTRSFIVLQRDLGLFCKGLTEHNLMTHEYNAFHNLTLVDPYVSQPFPEAPKFLSRKLQELLLAPYRKLRGFPLFTIKGAVEKDLSRVAVSEITSTGVGTDLELYLAELAELKSKGNDSFRAGAYQLAVNAYQQAITKILSLGRTAEGERLQEIGGPDFAIELTHYFSI